jgi:hypothetical protein
MLNDASIEIDKLCLHDTGYYCDTKKSGPTSQDAETPSHPGFHPPHLLYNRRGLTRNNSEFRRPEMWALDEKEVVFLLLKAADCF